jgi:hypothetical protein
MECRTKIDILSISSVETDVPIEKPPQAKLRADYTIPKCFINFIMIKIKHHRHSLNFFFELLMWFPFSEIPSLCSN